MILLDAHHSQGFSDEKFERSEIKSGILDINSAPRRKVDGPPPSALATAMTGPLTTWFALGVGRRERSGALKRNLPRRAYRPILPGRTAHKNRLNVNATSPEIFIRE